MWRINLRLLVLCLVLIVPLVVPGNRHDASAGTYSPCVVPPTIGGAVKPDVLFVNDYSGSMQGPAYYPPVEPGKFQYYNSKVIHYHNNTDSNPVPVNGLYSRWKDYSGYFAINKYYRYNTSGYFEVSSTKPAGAYTFAVDKIRIYKVTDESGLEGYVARVWTQASFQNQLQVNDPVCFENISKKEFLTKNSWIVTAINTSTYMDFTIPLKLNKTYVEDPVDGTPDSGTVFKRVAGAFMNGYAPSTTNPRYTAVSGNVINYLSASRYDNALMALIGGRASISGDIATMKPLGARAHLYEASEFRCTTHMYPSTSTTTDYNSGFILDKTTRLSVTSNYTGTISTSSPCSAHTHTTCTQSCSNKSSCSSCRQRSGTWCASNRSWVEVWTFSLSETGNTRVYITMKKPGSSTLSCPYLKLYSGATPSGTPLACDSGGGGSTYARIDMSLAPGTYSIEATTYSDSIENGQYYLESNVGLKEHPTLNTNTLKRNEALGNVSDLWCKLQKPKSERSGIIQQNFTKVRFGFIMFRGSPGGSTAGRIQVPLHNTNMDTLVNAFQGVGSGYGNTYSNQTTGVFPYSGTPTGEAMTEAQSYLAQTIASGGINSDFQQPGSLQDPYYSADYRTPPQAVAVPCRKSFVVLISDGVWSSHMNASGIIDPVEPAYAMHHADMRSDMSGDQTADVYTVYTFGEEAPGRNSMKEVAMYGGFTDKDANGWPYPRTGLPDFITDGGDTEDRSCNLRWPLVECCRCPRLSDVQNSTCSWKSSISACWDASNQWCLASLCPDGFRNSTYRNPSGCTYGDRCACNGYAEGTGGDSECQEWATRTYESTANWRNGVVCYFKTLHGVPTNYFQATDGAEIEEALTLVLGRASQQTGAAGSVATVSQKYQGEDLVVRAAFEAADPDKMGGYKWYGHLETYLPFASGGENVYDFDMPCNANKVFCKDMPGDTGACHSPKTCWDAAEMLRTLYENSVGGDTNTSNRKIFTATHYWDTATAKWLTPNWTTSTSTGTCAPNPVPTSTWQFENFPKWGDISGSTDCKNKWKALLGTSNDTATEKLIYWIRGSGKDASGTALPLRNREGNILGDIVYSTPVVVSSAPPMGVIAPQDPDYTKFLDFRSSFIEAQKKHNKPSNPTTAQKLKKMVYVGANDGMIHAFILGVWDWDNETWIYTPGTGTGQDPDVGKELWSYMPSNLLSQMKCLAETTTDAATNRKEYAVESGCNHRYMVDLSPSAYQVYMTSSNCATDVDRDGAINFRPPDGTGKDYRTDCALVGNPQQSICDGKCWRTIIVGGERGGGDLYFALDVTNPDQPKLLWEFSMIKDIVEFNLSSGTRFRTPVGLSKSVSNQYDALKVLPMTWSRGQVGRLTLPTSGTYYVGDPANETLTAWPGSVTSIPADEKGDRHFIFVGGGFRIFQDTLTEVNGVTLTTTLPKSSLDVMRKPRFLAIDVETGKNVLRYLWPYMIAKTESDNSSVSPLPFDPPARGSASPYNYVPYAMSDPVIQDFWDLYHCDRARTEPPNSYFPRCANDTDGSPTLGMDGYIDHIYVGDLNGNFYSIKFVNFREDATSGQFGISVDVRPTKGLNEAQYQP